LLRKWGTGRSSKIKWEMKLSKVTRTSLICHDKDCKREQAGSGIWQFRAKYGVLIFTRISEQLITTGTGTGTGSK